MLLPAAGWVQAQTEPTVTTYNVPIWFELSNQTAVAVNATNSIVFKMPYPLSSSASVILYYTVNDTNAKISLSADGGNATEVLLSSGGASDAYIPLSVKPQDNLTVQVISLGSAVNANISVTVLDTARFSVSVSPSSLTLLPGGSNSVTVTITQNGGPTGTLLFDTHTDTNYIKATVSPTQVSTAPGASKTIQWSFTASKTAVKGTYHAYLSGTFTSDQIPGKLTFHFADVNFPIDLSATSIAGNSATTMLALGFGVIIFLVLIAKLLAGRR